MKHVFGMAKSCLDLRGAKGPKLELDYLRMVYAIKELNRNNEKAAGYLMVMTPEIKDTVDKAWAPKYEAVGLVTVIAGKLTEAEFEDIEEEKKRNYEGMMDGARGKPGKGLSNAPKGKQLIEAILMRSICQCEPGAQIATNEGELPFKINWDYYGKSDS